MRKAYKKIILLKKKITRLVNPKKNLYWAGVIDGLDLSLNKKTLETQYNTTSLIDSPRRKRSTHV